MKKIFMLFLAITLMFSIVGCSESPNPQEENNTNVSEEEPPDNGLVEVVDKINNLDKFEGAKEIWEEYTDNSEAQKYILININDDAIVSLCEQGTGNAIIGHYEGMGEILSTMMDIGLENFSLAKIKNAVKVYMDSQDKSSEQIESILNQADELYDSPEEFSQLIQETVGGLQGAKDIETLILNDALEKEQKKLIDSLKNPKSFELLSLNGTSIEYDEETGVFVVLINITYTATNSFGGTEKEVYTATCGGTYEDGTIKYK
jgi:hypothetical protein